MRPDSRCGNENAPQRKWGEGWEKSAFRWTVNESEDSPVWTGDGKSENFKISLRVGGRGGRPLEIKSVMLIPAPERLR